MRTFQALVLTLSLSFALAAAPWSALSADPADIDTAYFTVDSVVIEEVLPPEGGGFFQWEGDSFYEEDPLTYALEEAHSTPAEISTDTNQASDWLGNMSASKVITSVIVNLGKEAWKIVEANRPVAKMSTDTASALPQGVRSWNELESWKTPTSKVYKVTYKNAYGAKVVDFSYRVLFTHGGTVNGKGKYLTNVTIVPSNVTVAWGYTLDAVGTVPSVTNAGTRANPLAAAELQLKWSVSTVLKKQETSVNYYVRGDGYFVDLSNGTP